MSRPRILVVSSCTGEKASKPANQLTLKDFKDPQTFAQREAELRPYTTPAVEIYTGQQHLRAREGIQLLRQVQPVDFWILSAGYGFIPEDRTVVPYEVTFNTLKGHEVLDWARHLKIHGDFAQLVQNYDLIFVLLGENYLKALELPVSTRADQTFVFLTSTSTAKFIKTGDAKTFILPLSNPDAKHFKYGLVGLKGFLLKKFAEQVLKNPDLLETIWSDPGQFMKVLEVKQPAVSQEALFELPKSTPAKKLSTKASKKSDSEDEEDAEDDTYLPIPDYPEAPNLHLGMQYYIPEWDDRVDPGYDFLTDTATEDRDPYLDDVYAHEIYSTPNYDGVLLSKVKVDESKSKRARIEAVGVHRFIRFPKDRPLMGDCGAFGYIKEEEPPYNTPEILEYYQKLGFDFGVSIDHLIVGPWAQPGAREKRYDITLKNLEDFLKLHRSGGYTFTPMGAVQGWSPETYAEMAKAAIEMGYDYIALGGLARAQSKEILEILKAIHPHLRVNTRMHLFGVARINAIPAFRHMGVTSFDSASPLRRAWLGSGANFHTQSSKMYAAIRIPPVDGHGVRVRRLIEAGVADATTLRKLEEGALKALRDFDRGQLGVDETLEAILAYDELVELPRDGVVDPIAQAKRREKHAKTYREILEDKPWKACDCVICQGVGIETIIFRGNNRNRRRGFHNTYVFYKRFKALLANTEKGETIDADS